MIALLLALQAIACTPANVCRALEAAAAAQVAAGRSGVGYRATVETESATLNRSEGRVEGAAILEQTSSSVRWSADGRTLHERLNGWRSSTNTVPLTRLATARIGWLAGGMNGSRLALVHRSGPVDGVETLESPGEVSLVIHPLAPDRTSFYAFSGGAEVTRDIQGSSRRVIRIDVAPAVAASRDTLLFEGEMDLDPQTGGLVRLLGWIRAGTIMVELINQGLPDGTWVPLVQRFELESSSKRTWGFGSAVQIISRFYEVERESPPPAAGPGHAIELSSAPKDSLRSFRGWRMPFGSMTHRPGDERFASFRSTRLRSSGPPVISIQGYLPGEFLRINKIEGIFTGLSLLARLRNAAPGFAIHATGGYAWHENAVRGRVGAGWSGGPWTLEAGAARELSVTNKFREQFDNPVLGGLVGRDNWDYLERRGAVVSLTRRLDLNGSAARVDAGGVEDRAVVKHMSRSLGGWLLRDNRGIAEGHYFRVRAVLDWNPEVSPGFARTGVGFRAEVEQAGGDLDYTRVEARLVGRAGAHRLVLLTRLHGGAVFGDRPPPQQLFEMGGPAGLPGYDYKEFAGDRAMLFRTRLTYALPMLDTRKRTGRGATWPALAPAISVGFSAGIADARTAGGEAAVLALGVKRKDGTGELVTDPLTGLPLPAAVAGSRLHSSVDIRLGLFGDALAVGFARALERGRTNQFIFAFGRQF